jgi:ABC-2 type transport system ATP-binding protein
VSAEKLSVTAFVENVRFEYLNALALAGVSLSLSPGSITALVGPNGAGKSTLMQCLAALKVPQFGKVTVAGLDTKLHPRDCHAHVGFLPDFFGLYEKLTARQSLTYMAGAQRVPQSEIAERIFETAESLELTELLDKKPSEMSRGQRQRLGIGQAIIHHPELLILDEPASGLDPESRHKLSELLIRFRERGMTILVSSHILAELEEYATEMIVLEKGKLLDHYKCNDHATKNEHVLVLTFAGRDSSLPDFLRVLPSVSRVEIEGEEVLCTFSGGNQEQVEIVGSLVQANFPLLAAVRQEETMKDRYLQRKGQVTPTSKMGG